MQRRSVSSKNIASIGYEEASETLEVEFLNSTLYQYFNVPIGVYEELMSAPSHGSYFNACIKGQYSFEKL
jgi:hypothetical protein